MKLLHLDKDPFWTLPYRNAGRDGLPCRTAARIPTRPWPMPWPDPLLAWGEGCQALNVDAWVVVLTAG
jgi:hypothetical protein